ncbi:zinc-binding alcohol dehydrogenase family protein [Bifidobacterium sp.]|uniref:zinc-binding alcohol dehydrogenase family protein n=1 Tax=Bifidobacterium sp. TaxID=41200 RepID=UPI0039EB13E2
MAEESEMSAVVTFEGGSADNPKSLSDAMVARPKSPRRRDILVRIHAISVNPVDTKIRASANAASPSSPPLILGWDAVGEVVETGPDARFFNVGDRVWYAGDVTRQGSYAAYELVDERIVGHAPATLDDAHAAAMPLTGITAWEALFDKLRVDRTPASNDGGDDRQSLLVVGAAGGVGSMVIQLAHALTSLRIIALASREESRRWALDMGADDVVDYRDDDVAAKIQGIAPNGIDWAFSAYSKGNIGLFNAVMRPFGEIVAIDDEKNLDWYSLKDKALSWHWEFMFARPKHHADDMIRQHGILEKIAELVDSGVIRSTMTMNLSPVDAGTLRKAHGMVEGGHMVGKVTLSRDDRVR